MRDAVFLLLTMAMAVVLAAGSVVIHAESLLDPALLALIALGGGFVLWGVLEDRRASERSQHDL